MRKNIFYSIILTVISGLAIGWDIGRDYLYFIWTQIPDWIIYERYLIPLIINTVIGATLLILIIRYLIQGRITILDKSASPIPLALSFVNLILYTNLNPLSFYLSWIPVFLVSFVIFILGWRVEVTYNIKWMVILEGAFFIRRKKWQEVKQLRIKGRKQFTKLKEEILEREDNRGVFFKNVKISQYTRGYLWKNTIRDGCSALIGRTSWNDVKTSYRESSQQVRFFRKNIQIIFQNPYESLSPRFNVLDAVAEPLRLMNIVEDEDEIEKMVINELEEVGLVPGTEFLDRYPHELSGGQRQRIGVARAFILDPEFVVADEPVSMLDVSIRVGVLKIMRELTKSRGTGFLFITHDLALARHMCDRVAAMYLGRIVELGPTEELVHRPLHPYTKALIKAVPKADPDARRTEDLPIQGEVPSGIQVPSGCRFHPRCPYAIDKCTEEVPELVDTHIEGHKVACIRYKEINDL